MEKQWDWTVCLAWLWAVAFVQVHYYRERQRAKAECERLEQSIGQMQKQYVDVVKTEPVISPDEYE